ncbi:LINE-1 reverse transcriptase homolog [Linum grandiflorum]
MLEEFWQCPGTGIGLLFRLAKKLKLLKSHLKGWNLSTFKRVDKEIQDGLCIVEALDRKEESGEFTREDWLHRANLKCELDKLWKLEEISWKQKARDNWLKLGDRNTKYFHRIANFNRRRNHLDGIFMNGEQVEGQRNVAAAAVNFYEQLYDEPRNLRPFLDSCGGSMLTQEVAEGMVRCFSERDVWEAVQMCAGEKAPGPDGFPMAFFKRNWTILKREVCEAVLEFFVTCSLPLSLNSTFVTLVPKKDAVTDFKDLRPISLVGGVYKIISKMLIGRMKPVMGEIISPNQCAFVGNRQILDAALIANEIIDSRVRSLVPGLVIKLDIEKAYDHVNWECLFKVMDMVGFHPIWISWVKCCVSTASFSVLVNGEASGYFRSSRGLRQGDPLSPFLFTLVMQVLSGILAKVEAQGWLQGFHMNETTREGKVSHIFYADDALLFCEASANQVRYLVASLICFESITGLKVNVHKSCMYAVGNVPNVEEMADIMGCQVESLPSIYLGLPLGAKGSSPVIWEPVISNMERKLECWKTKFLSFGGRVTLLKSVLVSLPVYYMSILKAPVKVLNRLEKMQNRFLWSGNSEKDKIHWINWQNVKTPTTRGGLGVPDLRILNSALLSKWAWRYAVERNSWWRGLIIAKCGVGSSLWVPKWDSGPAGCSMWKAVVTNSSIFWKYGFVDPGGGMCAFWFDYWVQGVRLCDAYPRIVAAAQSLDTNISDLCSFNDRWIWNIPLSTTLRGGALTEWQHLLNRLASMPADFLTAGPDSIVWPLEISSVFSVKSLRLALTSEKFPGEIRFPHSTIWNKGAPSKVQCFCWQVYLGKIASQDNLQKRGFLLANRCVLCYKELESIDHMFLSCEFTMSIWRKTSSALSIHGPLSSSVCDVISSWKGLNCISTFQVAMKGILHSILWFIWLERNDRIFKGKEKSSNAVFRRIMLNVGNWSYAAGFFSLERQRQWSHFIFDPG